MVDQHAYRDRVASLSGHQPWQVVSDRGVEPNLAAFDLLQDRRGSEGLGDTADAVPHVWSNRAAGAEIGDAGSAAPYLVAIPHFGEHSRHSRAMKLLRGGRQLREVSRVLHCDRRLTFAVRINSCYSDAHN